MEACAPLDPAPQPHPQPQQQHCSELASLAALALPGGPELVTDMEVEAALEGVEAALVSGLGWVVEEGLSNLSESNFAAVG